MVDLPEYGVVSGIVARSPKVTVSFPFIEYGSHVELSPLSGKSP